jgi:hypothetical protein
MITVIIKQIMELLDTNKKELLSATELVRLLFSLYDKVIREPKE